jgi:ATP-dependent DNA helicase RecQ
VAGRTEFSPHLPAEFGTFAREAACVCGHNVLRHDLPLLRKAGLEGTFFAKPVVDTLYLSALLFPEKPYHKLVKDYKLYAEYPPNNPVWDAGLARQLFADEVVAFYRLPPALQAIYYHLLHDTESFGGFFKAVGYRPGTHGASLVTQVKTQFAGCVCAHADVAALIRRDREAFAYALALVTTRNPESVTPPWLVKNYPHLTPILYALRLRGCTNPACTYCAEWLDPHRALQHFLRLRRVPQVRPHRNGIPPGAGGAGRRWGVNRWWRSFPRAAASRSPFSSPP